MTIWLTAPGMAKADTIQNKTTIDSEVIFGVNSYGGVIPTTTRLGSNTIMSDRVRLNIKTTFTGKDRLKIQFQSSNSTPFNTSVTGTNMTRSGYDVATGNNTNLSLLQYRRAIFFGGDERPEMR